jgi:hypothetical protein
VLTRASEGRWLLPAAFILLGLIWGSSFAWIKVAVAELDLRLLLGTGVVVLGIAIVGLRYDAMVSLATRVARR